jgi:hypothetical protein
MSGMARAPRRKRIYERLHPGRRWGPRLDARAAGRRTGISDRTIRHEVQIGSMPVEFRVHDSRNPSRTPDQGFCSAWNRNPEDPDEP